MKIAYKRRKFAPRILQVLRPGEEYEYTSGPKLESPMGTMEGTYQMVNQTGETFDIQIPLFTLEVPGTLN